MGHGKFVTAINCIDGRVQLPVIKWMKERYASVYVDMITEAGADRAVAYGSGEEVESVKRRVEISVNGHGSRVIAVVGHADCAGNPATKEEHLAHITKGVERIKTWELGAEVIGLWLDLDWKVEVVDI